MCQVWISQLMLIGAEEIESLWSYRSGEKILKNLPIFFNAEKNCFFPSGKTCILFCCWISVLYYNLEELSQWNHINVNSKIVCH